MYINTLLNYNSYNLLKKIISYFFYSNVSFILSNFILL